MNVIERLQAGLFRHRSLRGLCLGLLISSVLTACAPQPTNGVTPESTVAGARVTPRAAASTPAPTPTPGAQATPARTGPSLPAATPEPSGADCGPITPAATEGPYFKAGSPERSDLTEPGMEGTRLVLSGKVLTSDCRPVAGALVEIWQADASGVYDNSGYRLRGHQLTDRGGMYSFLTMIPGEYANRTSHIHVKVQGPDGNVLTTQLYFPNDPRNSSDSLFRPELVMSMRDTQDGKGAGFNFVLARTQP